MLDDRGGTLLEMQTIHEAEEYVRHHQIVGVIAFAVTFGAAAVLIQDVFDPYAHPLLSGATNTIPAMLALTCSLQLDAGSTMWKC